MPWQMGTALTTAPGMPYAASKAGRLTAVPSAQNQMPLAPVLPEARRSSVTG